MTPGRPTFTTQKESRMPPAASPATAAREPIFEPKAELEVVREHTQTRVDSADRPADTRSAGLPASLYAAARLYAGEQLQHLLVATIDLGLVIKHAHWNMHGGGSNGLHLLCDELSDGLAGQGDLLARRAAELGVAPDGRAATVAAESPLPELDDGPLPAGVAASAIADGLDSVADLAHRQLNGLGASDPATRHVLIGFAQLIERHRWKLGRSGLQG
ncbi:MAG: starvation-inducible DNA-binding protein [Solirubrobacteraceae bacterium]|jgi:starvation-inducible DNA-binding protein|nr:starvation-inducible DNA-binding protein [Solirubrobacteraceae bacterium]